MSKHKMKRSSRNKGKKWFARYKSEDRQEKNQARKRTIHLNRHPEDEQSKVKAKSGYKRKAPKSPNNTNPRPIYLDGAGRRVSPPSFGREQ